MMTWEQMHNIASDYADYQIFEVKKVQSFTPTTVDPICREWQKHYSQAMEMMNHEAKRSLTTS